MQKGKIALGLVNILKITLELNYIGSNMPSHQILTNQIMSQTNIRQYITNFSFLPDLQISILGIIDLVFALMPQENQSAFKVHILPLFLIQKSSQDPRRKVIYFYLMLLHCWIKGITIFLFTNLQRMLTKAAKDIFLKILINFLSIRGFS